MGHGNQVPTFRNLPFVLICGKLLGDAGVVGEGCGGDGFRGGEVRGSFVADGDREFWCHTNERNGIANVFIQSGANILRHAKRSNACLSRAR